MIHKGVLQETAPLSISLSIHQEGFGFSQFIGMDAPKFLDAVIKAGIGMEPYFFGDFCKGKRTVLQKLFGHKHSLANEQVLKTQAGLLFEDAVNLALT